MLNVLLELLLDILEMPRKILDLPGPVLEAPGLNINEDQLFSFIQ